MDGVARDGLRGPAESGGSAAGERVTPGKRTLTESLRGLGAAAEGKPLRGGDGGTSTGAPTGTPTTDGGAQAASASPPTITATTTAGPTFGPRGASMWHIRWSTTGRTGWIVQRVNNTASGTHADGRPVTTTTMGILPEYYEAWSVDGSGAITPHVSGEHDYWDGPPFETGSRGTWTTAATVHWIAGATRPSGMSPGQVANAGILVSSIGAPSGLSSSVLSRNCTVRWDDTSTPKVDEGVAS